MSSQESEEHPLITLLLKERLPTLGLDSETYGPYIVALFPLSSTFGDELDELEGWDEILELLQASSELQDLEENVWVQLKEDLLSTWQSYRKGQIEQQKEELLTKEQNLQKVLELERDIAKMNAEAKVNDATGSDNNSSIDDAAKRALLNRFGYEDDENDDTGKGVDDAATTDTAVNSNQSTTTTSKKQQHHPPVTTKREEQQKTKAAQQQKIDAKEERRKRAMKGERRR
jgi:hypothetical protein